MWIYTLLQFLLLGFRCCCCGSGLVQPEIREDAKQTVEPWELCRWFSYSSSVKTKRKSKSALAQWQRTLPSMLLLKKPSPSFRGGSVCECLKTLLKRKEVWHQARWGGKSNFLLSQGDPQEGEGKSGQIGLTPLSWEILSGDWKENLTREVTAYCQEMEGTSGETPNHSRTVELVFLKKQTRKIPLHIQPGMKKYFRLEFSHFPNGSIDWMNVF